MQKVVGSSPIIRSLKAPLRRGFLGFGGAQIDSLGLSLKVKDDRTHDLAALLCLDDPLAGRAEHESPIRGTWRRGSRTAYGWGLCPAGQALVKRARP